MSNQSYVFDFTYFTEREHTDIELCLKDKCKKYCFQLEECPSTKKLHYQGRISLKEKKRINQLQKFLHFEGCHFSVTSNENKNNDFYVSKEETRIKGPWRDTDEEMYIPRQVREIKELRPWQNDIIKMSKVFDTRSINIIYDPNGNTGKSVLTMYMRAYKLGRKIPYCNTYKDIMRMVCDMPISNCYLFDLPRSIDKKVLAGLFSAIEDIKGGYAFDDRYKFKEIMFDCPQIFVFTNEQPNRTYLSEDRWKIWTIIGDELAEF